MATMEAVASVPPTGLAFYDKGPGPAAYKLPPLVGKKNHALTHQIRPAYPFGLKQHFIPGGIGPGPACVNLQHGVKSRWDWSSYKYTMRQKYRMNAAQYGPGPAKYPAWNPDLIRNKAPTCTLRYRHSRLTGLHTPGPNVYDTFPMIGPKIPTRIAAAACTMKGSRKDALLKSMSPGPIYNIGSPELLKEKSRAFTMRIKWPELSCTQYKASPVSYDVLKAKIYPGTPAWDFGRRYNDFTGIFRTECDKSSYEPLDSY